jgi:hypothetical protein
VFSSKNELFFAMIVFAGSKGLRTSKRAKGQEKGLGPRKGLGAKKRAWGLEKGLGPRKGLGA